MPAGKILVVDDDQNICELLRLYIEKEGYEVAIANDGRKALEAFEAEAPDLIMLDIMKKAIAGGYSSQGTMGGIYSQPYYVVGVPINVVNIDGSKTAIGAVFTAYNVRSFNSFRSELLRMALTKASTLTAEVVQSSPLRIWL